MFVEKELTPRTTEKKKKRKSNNFSVTELDDTPVKKSRNKSMDSPNTTGDRVLDVSQQKISCKKSAKKSKPLLPENLKKSGGKKEKPAKKSGGKKEKSASVKLDCEDSLVKEVKEEDGEDFVKLLMTSKDDLDEFNDGDLGSGGEDDDGWDDVREQENFIEAMSTVHGKKKKILTNRGTNQPLTEDSVPGEERVELTDLLNSLDSDTRELSRRAEGDKAASTLAAPLERPAAERISREAGYARVRDEVNLWDAVVHGRRLQETVTFPLENPNLRLQSSDQVVKTRFNASTPLEQQVAALLAGSKAVAQPGEDMSQIEKKALEGLTPREIAERKSELAKFRALQTYQEAKYRRQNKIKSKKFRKIARKEKSKEKLKELEMLAETDPQAAAEELERLDRKRMEERLTLKHRNASKYLQDQMRRYKETKNKDIAAVVQEQLQKHREILSKAKPVSDSDDDESEDDDVHVDASKLELDQEEEESYAEFSANYRKFWQAEKDKKMEVSGKEEIEDMFEDAEHNIKQRLAVAKSRLEGEEVEEEMDDKEVEEETGLEHAESLNYPQKSTNKLRPEKTAKPTSSSAKEDVDPDNYMTMESKKLKSDLPEFIGYNEDDNADSDDDDQRQIIAEAFAEDDVLADFQKEKAELIAASKPKDIDLTLPGWGEWGGGGLKPSKRKRKRFTIKAPPAEKRKDENKGNLIVNVDKDDKIRAHKVAKVPYQFSSVSDFEASIRTPVGSTFLPRTAFLKMVKPKVETKMGEVIEPINKSYLLKRNLVIKE